MRHPVLLVEDDPDLRELFVEVLEGYQVELASNGLEGVEKFRALNPRLAIVDVGLPGLNGFEVARQIRALPGGAGVRLIAMSGDYSSEALARAQAAGFDRLVGKPITSAELCALVEEAQ